MGHWFDKYRCDLVLSVAVPEVRDVCNAKKSTSLNAKTMLCSLKELPKHGVRESK